MDSVPITPKRKAQLDAYAERHGQDTAAALDEVLADYFAWEQDDFEESVAAVRQGYEDMKAGRTRLAEGVHTSLRRKHGLPG